jgi:hypothetical protein
MLTIKVVARNMEIVAGMANARQQTEVAGSSLAGTGKLKVKDGKNTRERDRGAARVSIVYSHLGNPRQLLSIHDY